MGIPGPVDVTTGLLGASTTMPGWAEYPIEATIRARWDVPLLIENDARASGRSLLDRLAGEGLRDLEHVAQRAHAGDPTVLAAIRDGAARLGRVLAAIVATVNPDTLVLGGTIGQLPMVAEEVERRVRQDAVERDTRKLRVISARFGDDSATIGLTVMVVRHVFSADAIDARLT